MNICKYVTKIHTCRALFSSHQIYKTRLPLLTKSLLYSRASFVSRNLHIKKDSKKMFGCHKLDQVPPQFNVVYTSSIGPWFIMFRVGMAMVSGTLATVYYILAPEFSAEFFQEDRGLVLLGATSFFIFFISAFSFSARQFLTRIYHHSDSGRFIGVKRTLFGRLRQLKYTPQDVKPILTKKSKSLEKWKSITVDIKGQKIHLQSCDFFSPVYYNMHFGAVSDSSIDFMAQEPKF